MEFLKSHKSGTGAPLLFQETLTILLPSLTLGHLHEVEIISNVRFVFLNGQKYINGLIKKENLRKKFGPKLFQPKAEPANASSKLC